VTDVIGHVAAWLREDAPPSETPIKWNPERFRRLEKWLNATVASIGPALCESAKGEPTGQFDEEGREGKMVSPEEGRRVLSLLTERMKALVEEAGIIAARVEITLLPGDPPNCGLGIVRTRVDLMNNSPVPPEFI
jgi:hypothetical protein